MALNSHTNSPAIDHAFGFNSNVSVHTGTLSELTKCLEVELEKDNGEAVNSRTLKRTLDFLRTSIGLDISSSKQPLPMSVLKTVRLLFLADLRHSRNVLNLLAPPGKAGDATMEFASVTTIPRDLDAADLIQDLCESLALEIDRSKLNMQSRLLRAQQDHSVAESLLLLVERTNDEVSRVLQEAFGSDERALADSFRSMTESLNKFRVQMSEQ